MEHRTWGWESAVDRASSSRARWLIVILAFLLAATALLVSAPARAQTTDAGEIALNERFIDWVDRDDTVHLFADALVPGGDATDIFVPAGSTVVFGFEFSGPSVEDLEDFLESGGADIDVSINSGPDQSANSGYQEPFTAPAASSGPAWQWDHDGDGTGDGNGNGLGDWIGPILFFRYESMVLPEGTTTFEFDLGGLTDTITVETSCEAAETCDFEDPEGEWEAAITCDDDCDVVVHDPGSNVADIEVTDDTEFTMVLRTTAKGPPPGRARVDKIDPVTEEVIDTLPKCTGKTPVDCVKIIRIKGARTQYTLILDEDPRFRFR